MVGTSCCYLGTRLLPQAPSALLARVCQQAVCPCLPELSVMCCEQGLTQKVGYHLTH